MIPGCGCGRRMRQAGPIHMSVKRRTRGSDSGAIPRSGPSPLKRPGICISSRAQALPQCLPSSPSRQPAKTQSNYFRLSFTPNKTTYASPPQNPTRPCHTVWIEDTNMPTLTQPATQIATLPQGISVPVTPSPSPRTRQEEKSTFCRDEANLLTPISLNNKPHSHNPPSSVKPISTPKFALPNHSHAN